MPPLISRSEGRRIRINSYWSHKEVAGLNFCESESRTKQEFAKEADINNIMAQYVKTGVLPASEREPQYGDFLNATDYREALEAVLAAEEDFSQLPSDVRERFENDPAQLLEFVENEDNYEEALELGLLAEDALPPAVPEPKQKAAPEPPQPPSEQE